MTALSEHFSVQFHSSENLTVQTYYTLHNGPRDKLEGINYVKEENNNM